MRLPFFILGMDTIKSALQKIGPRKQTRRHICTIKKNFFYSNIVTKMHYHHLDSMHSKWACVAVIMGTSA